MLERGKTDTIVGRTKVTALLNSLPGYGPAKVTVLMQRTGIAPSRRITGLSERGIRSWVQAKRPQRCEDERPGSRRG